MKVIHVDGMSPIYWDGADDSKTIMAVANVATRAFEDGLMAGTMNTTPMKWVNEPPESSPIGALRRLYQAVATNGYGGSASAIHEAMESAKSVIERVGP